MTEPETAPAGFNLDAEAGREADAAKGGLVFRTVVLEETVADDQLDADALDGGASDDDECMDDNAQPTEV
jgi:hypothetical protein